MPACSCSTARSLCARASPPVIVARGGKRSLTRPSMPWFAAKPRSWRSCGAGMPSRSSRSWARPRSWNLRIPRRCPPRAGSSARAPSPERTLCCRIWVPIRSTGGSPSRTAGGPTRLATGGRPWVQWKCCRQHTTRAPPDGRGGRPGRVISRGATRLLGLTHRLPTAHGQGRSPDSEEDRARDEHPVDVGTRLEHLAPGSSAGLVIGVLVLTLIRWGRWTFGVLLHRDAPREGEELEVVGDLQDPRIGVIFVMVDLWHRELYELAAHLVSGVDDLQVDVELTEFDALTAFGIRERGENGFRLRLIVREDQ